MGRRRPSRGQDWKRISYAEWLASFVSGFQTPYTQRYDVVWLKHLMQSSLRPLSVKLAGSAIMAWSDWARLTKLIKCFFLSPQDILFLCVVYWGKGRWGRRACRGLLTDCPPLDHPLYIQLPAGKIICGIKNFFNIRFWQRKVSHWTSWYEIMHN